MKSGLHWVGLGSGEGVGKGRGRLFVELHFSSSNTRRAEQALLRAIGSLAKALSRGKRHVEAVISFFA